MWSTAGRGELLFATPPFDAAPFVRLEATYSHVVPHDVAAQRLRITLNGRVLRDSVAERSSQAAPSWLIPTHQLAPVNVLAFETLPAGPFGRLAQIGRQGDLGIGLSSIRLDAR